MALKSFKEDFLPEKVNVSECFEKMHVVDEDVSKFDHARLSRVDQVLDFLNQVDKINALFLIDLTGSMGAHLDEAKKSMTNVYRKILLSSPHARLSVSIIGYRDYDNNSNISPHYEILPFTESISTIATFMANLEATGGTDDAEDVVGALAQALDQDWTRNGAGTKVLLHIADAPCHGSLFHSPELTDRYPDGDPRGIDPADILKQMAALNIHYYFAKISSVTDQMISMFNTFVCSMDDFVTVVSLRKPSDFMRVVEVSIRESISRMTSAVNNLDIHVGGTCSIWTSRSTIFQTKYVKELPLWSALSEQSAAIFSAQRLDSADQVISICLYPTNDIYGKLPRLRLVPIQVGMLSSESKSVSRSCNESNLYRIKVAPHAFAEGSMRTAHHGMTYIDCKWVPMVFKQFKTIADIFDESAFRRYFHQTEVSWAAQSLAKEFNKIHARDVSLTPIYVLISHVFEADARRHVGNKYKKRCSESQAHYFNAEPYLPPGNFVKFTNNAGYTNPDCFNKTLAAFSLWTYKVTRFQMMVVDLQGVVNDTFGIVLTDPAILCTNLNKFGPTNLGSEAMGRCLTALEKWEEMSRECKKL